MNKLNLKLIFRSLMIANRSERGFSTVYRAGIISSSLINNVSKSDEKLTS